MNATNAMKHGVLKKLKKDEQYKQFSSKYFFLILTLSNSVQPWAPLKNSCFGRLSRRKRVGRLAYCSLARLMYWERFLLADIFEFLRLNRDAFAV